VTTSPDKPIRRRRRASHATNSAAGKGVDAQGNQVIDPTDNVLDLVDAESKYTTGMRSTGEQLFDAKIASVKETLTAKLEAESRIQNWMRDSEMKRLTESAAQRQFYETRIADMLRTSVESTSTLVSGQLVSIQGAFNERVSQLERFRYELGGRSGGISETRTERREGLGQIMLGCGIVISLLLGLANLLHLGVAAPVAPPYYPQPPAPTLTMPVAPAMSAAPPR
jgi:hypothetical protein